MTIEFDNSPDNEQQEAEYAAVVSENTSAQNVAIKEKPIKKALSTIDEHVDLERAAEFLKRTLEWGESGLDFIERLKELENEIDTLNKPEAGYFNLRQAVDKITSENYETPPSPQDVFPVLFEASQIRLIIGQDHFGYPPRPDEIQTLYVVNKTPLLGELSLNNENEPPLNREDAKELIERDPFFPDSDLGFREGLTGKEFFSLFNTPKTITEIFNDSDLFKKDAPFGPHIRQAIEGKIDGALQYGLLIRDEQSSHGKMKITFRLSSEGRDLLK